MTELETLDNGTRVFLSKTCRFSRDALLLAHFSSAKKGVRLLDIGAGCGIVSLALRDSGRAGHVTALEISEGACSLMRRAAEANALADYDIINADLRAFRCERKFDAAVCNPPYFKAGAGAQSENSERNTARREAACTLNDVFICAARCLKERGRIALCYRPERLVELIYIGEKHGFAAKRLRFVKHRADGEPWLALFEAGYRCAEGLSVEPDIITD